MRLACQIRPSGDLTVTPLMPADAGLRAVMSAMDPRSGVEREVAVLFADLRGFTRFSEGRLPYDTVFVLNRYFATMGSAIENAGGRVDKFIGDGIMALFGLERGPERAARTALAAAMNAVGHSDASPAGVSKSRQRPSPPWPSRRKRTPRSRAPDAVTPDPSTRQRRPSMGGDSSPGVSPPSRRVHAAWRCWGGVVSRAPGEVELSGAQHCLRGAVALARGVLT